MKTIEEKAKAYDEALERAKEMIDSKKTFIGKECLEQIFPELRESEDERIRKALIEIVKWLGFDSSFFVEVPKDKVRAWLEKQKEIPMPNSTELIEMWHKEKAMLKEKDFRGDEWRLAHNAFIDGFARGTCVKFEKQKEPADKGEISDGYHTFNELYYYRMLYNAAFFNLLPKHLVHKSRRHHDGEECFGGGWFIVMAQLPTGQISNHYELKDWDLFQVPEQDKADEWDGHTPKEAAERIFRYLQLKQKPVVCSQEDERILAGIIGKIDHDQSYGVSKDDMLRLLNSIPSRILYARNL